MEWGSIVSALSGPLAARFFPALILSGVYLFLRTRDAEGRMGGYALVAFYLIARDLSYAFTGQETLYLVSDIILVGLLCWVAAAERRGLLFWMSLGVLAVPCFALGLTAFTGQALLFRREWLLLFALPSIGILLLRGSRGAPIIGLSLGLYVLLSAVFSSDHGLVRVLSAPVLYSVLIVPAILFLDNAQKELVSAVEHYEESVDSLYELFDMTGSAIKPGFSLQDVLEGMIGVAVDKTQADGGMILLAEEYEEAIAVRALRGRFPPPFKLPESLPKDEEHVAAHLRHSRFRIGEGLFGELARSGAPLFIPEGQRDARVVRNGDDEWLRLGSLMAAPLYMRDKVIGAIALARGPGSPFAEGDFDRLKLLASFGSMAVANAYTFLEVAERGDIEREAAIAEEIQRTVLPKRLPELGRFTVGASSLPARGVCSDYYDVIAARPGKSIIAFGDVAGKGVAAGLIMVMIRSILHLIVNSAKDVSTLLSWVNRGLAGKVDMDHYATLGLVELDTSTGELEYANAAHQAPLIYRRAASRLEALESKSIPIGVERGTEYPSKRLRLERGDILLLYSDGVVEAMDEQGRQFSRKNLGSALVRYKDLGAREIAEAVREELSAFTGRARQHDDQTILVVKA